MKIKFLLPVLTLTIFPTMVIAMDTPQSDARQADQDTVIKKVVNYKCSNGKKVKVTYGFNVQGLPTYAQAYLNGKNRFMPINLYRSDMTGTTFGDENNFSLSTGSITSKKYRSDILVQSPSSEILYKNCSYR